MTQSSACLEEYLAQFGVVPSAFAMSQQMTVQTPMPPPLALPRRRARASLPKAKQAERKVIDDGM